LVVEVAVEERVELCGMCQDLLRSQYLDLVDLAVRALTALGLVEMVDRHLLAEAELQAQETVLLVALLLASMVEAVALVVAVVLLTNLTHHTELAELAERVDLELFTFT
jgi:hypothetical protein